MFKLYSCALCDWETTEGEDQDAFIHLETEHDLGRLWWRGKLDP